MIDAATAYDKGIKDGENALLKLLKMILDDAQFNHSPTYYKASLELVLELYGYGKEKEEN